MTEGSDPEVPGVADLAGEATAQGDVPAVEASLGAMLRQAREARGHSIADVVQVIRFGARQIEALERDDYATLPGATAVRGMVRNYAKFLKLDPTPLLARLEPSVPLPEADVRPPANIGAAEQPSLGERIPLRAVAWVCAVIVLAGMGYWLFGQLEHLSGASPSSVSPAADPAPSVASPGAAAVVEPVVLAPAPAVLASTDIPPLQAAAGAPVVGPYPGLRVEFDALSWIEVRDAGQRIVLAGEFPAGTRRNVEGRGPYQVWIGKASGVRLFMGERGIDLKPHTREEVARLRVE